jgi:hypothetical protein
MTANPIEIEGVNGVTEFEKDEVRDVDDVEIGGSRAGSEDGGDEAIHVDDDGRAIVRASVEVFDGDFAGVDLARMMRVGPGPGKRTGP